MVKARRSAPYDSGEPEQIAELGTVRPARRAAGFRLPRVALRSVVAPLTMLAVAGLTSTWMFVPSAETASEGAEPATPRPAATSLSDTSRSQPRPELFVPSASPTAAPSASAAPSAAPSVAASAAPSASSTPSAPVTTAPAPAAAAAPVKESPAPDYTTLGEAAGTQYATAAVNVRTGPGVAFEELTTLAAGDDVPVTGRAVDGWQQVVYKKEAGWVKASFLSAEQPAVEEAKETIDTSSSCPEAENLEANLTSRTVGVLRALCAQFDGVTYGGYRPGSGSYHGSGRAIDVMVSGDYGWQIAKWARANASELGVIEVLYSQKIWTTQRTGEGWRSFSDRGGDTANHYDHVHISVG